MPAGIAKLLLVAALGYQTPRLITAIPPSSPWNAVIGNTVLATVELDQKGTMTQVRVLEGVTPFVEEAERSISQWQFDPARLDGNAVATEVSVIMMFRPHSFGNFGVGGPRLASPSRIFHKATTRHCQSQCSTQNCLSSRI